MRALLVILFVGTALLTFFVPTVKGQIYIPYVNRGQSDDTPSPAPTITETPENTATSTATPSPTATKPVEGITVLDNHLPYFDSIEYLHIAGEVRNDTNNSARFVKIIANLFNAQDQLVDTDYTYARLDVLPVGETSCFEIIFSDAPAYDHYTFETTYSNTDENSLPISVFGHSGTPNATFDDWYEVIGQARNDSNVNAEFVKIIGTLYRNNNQVLECDFTYTNVDVLAPSQVSTWKITFTHAPDGAVGTYKVQGQGREE